MRPPHEWLREVKVGLLHAKSLERDLSYLDDTEAIQTVKSRHEIVLVNQTAVNSASSIVFLRSAGHRLETSTQ
jgi:hypothetical protein